MSKSFSRKFNEMSIILSKKVDLGINEWGKKHDQCNGGVETIKNNNRGESTPKSHSSFLPPQNACHMGTLGSFIHKIKIDIQKSE
jgi:hypothetical protein